jgi:hypothetical protein
MDSESVPTPAETTSASQATPVDQGQGAATAGSKSTAPVFRMGPLLGLLTACVVGTVGWLVVEQIYPAFEIGEGYEIPNLGAPPELFERSRVAHAAVAQKNATLNLAILGGLIALGLAAAEGGLRKKWGMVFVAPVIGLVLGGLGGWLGGMLHESVDAEGMMTELPNVIKVHGVMMIPFGIGIGLALGLVTTNPKTVLKAGVVGGVTGGIAAVVYTMIISLAFSTVGTEDLVPDVALGRFLWALSAASLLGLIIPFAVDKMGAK